MLAALKGARHAMPYLERKRMKRRTARKYITNVDIYLHALSLEKLNIS